MPIIMVSIGADIDKDQERRNSHGARKREEDEGKKRRRKRKKRREEEAQPGRSRTRSDRTHNRAIRSQARSTGRSTGFPASYRKATGNFARSRLAPGRPDPGPDHPVTGPVRPAPNRIARVRLDRNGPSRSTTYLFDPSCLVCLYKHLGHPLSSLDKI